MESPKLLSRELGAVELILLSKLDGSDGIVRESSSATESTCGAEIFSGDMFFDIEFAASESAAKLECNSLLLAEAIAARDDRITVNRCEPSCVFALAAID